MIATRMVRDDVHEDAQIARMRLLDQLGHVIQRSEPRIHRSVVGYVISAIVKGRGVEG